MFEQSGLEFQRDPKMWKNVENVENVETLQRIQTSNYLRVHYVIDEQCFYF